MTWKDTIKKAPLADTVDRKNLGAQLEMQRQTGGDFLTDYVKTLMALSQNVSGLNVNVNIGEMMRYVSSDKRNQFIQNLDTLNQAGKGVVDFMRANTPKKPALGSQGTPIVQKNY